MGYTPPQLDVRYLAGAVNIKPPGTVTTDDIVIFPNSVDTYANITILGNGGIRLYCKAGNPVTVYDETVSALGIVYETANNHVKIISNIDAKDLYLATTGTGVLKFGSYTAGAATDSTGYITIKDAAGNTRKLMVQA